MLAGLSRMLGFAALALALAGAYLLDFHRDVKRGYTLLLLGALVFVLLPEAPSQTDSKSIHSRLAGWLSIVLLISAGIALCSVAAASVAEHPSIPGSEQAILWITGGLCLCLAFHLFDHHREPFVKLFERSDWAWIIGLAVAASAVRVLHLGVQPPGIVYDEIVPLSRTLALLKGANHAAFWTDDFALNGIFYQLNSLSIAYLGWLGFNTVQAAKVPGALCGGLSVGALYATARVLGTRPIAATAGVFLIYEGWHWVLSRLYYAYSGDLLWISLTTALLVAGLRSRRLSLQAAAGVAAAVGVTWLKTAVLIAPFAAVVLIDHVVTERATGWARFIPTLVWGLTFATCILPLAAQLNKQSTALTRFEQVSHNRTRELAQLGLTSSQGYVQGLLDSVGALQIEDRALPRHAPRPRRPILDLVESATATVGFITCLWRFPRDRAARLCLLGFLLFLWPAVSSYPEDLAAASRRMAGSSIFVAWMAAQGTSVAAKRLFRRKLQFPAMLLLATTSLVMNAYYLHTVYGADGFIWYQELGINRVYLVDAVRQAARLGPVFFRPTYMSEGAWPAVQDLANATIVRTPAELREKLSTHPGEFCTVILPWDTKFDGNDSPRWIEDLADIIPTHDWQWGPPDLFGVPLYRTAQIRLPQRGP
jgi:hypothetical protein